jgi:hypothetical protein
VRRRRIGRAEGHVRAVAIQRVEVALAACRI